MTYTTLEELRIDRNSILAKTDFLMLPDIEMLEADRIVLTDYRALLRDFPSRYTDETVSEAVIPNIPEPSLAAKLGQN